MNQTHSRFRLPVLAAVCLLLQSCAIGAAADLAATTVFTAGKLAVKGTGALIGAVIPDGKNDSAAADNSRKQPETAPNTPATDRFSGSLQPTVQQYDTE